MILVKNPILKINGILSYMMDCFDFINSLAITHKVNSGTCDNYKEDDIIIIIIIIIQTKLHVSELSYQHSYYDKQLKVVLFVLLSVDTKVTLLLSTFLGNWVILF